MAMLTDRGRGTQLPRVNSGEEKIYVTVRVRPLSDKEVFRSEISDWECTNDQTISYKHALLERSPTPATFTLDRVFGPECETQKVYEEGAKHVALSALAGLNSTIFAYGQTSSGKTFTMRGVTECAVADIFKYIELNTGREFVLKISALEIYNEVVRDLLTSDGTPLRLLDDKDKGTVVDKLKEEVVRDVNHLRQLIKICEAQRQVGETGLNDSSSRSHQIIRLTVESHPYGDAAGPASTSLFASLNFVDLAGSERASQTQADGARLKEGAHINRSLLTLSTCIRKLSEGSKKSGHIPYRDSKLTRILQHSLGGNAKTAIICTMSPAHSHVEQSRNTLAFAARAKEVINTTHINVVVSDKVLVRHLQREVARLEAELKVPGSATDSVTSTALLQAKDLQIQKMEEELKELQMQRDAAQARLDVVSHKLEAEEVAKNLAELAAKKLVEHAPRRLPINPGPQSTCRAPLLLTTNRRRWSDSGDYFLRKLEGQSHNLLNLPTTRLPRGPSLSFRQSSVASVMLVQEIRKLGNLQDELGEDANRALKALQMEVECLRLAQAGMNHDAASTIKKLQDEIYMMHNLRSSPSSVEVFENEEDAVTLPQSITVNHVTLRQELSRLGEKHRTDAGAAIVTLEEQLESVQRSLDKMILANEIPLPIEPGGSPKTCARKSKVPVTPASNMARQRPTADAPCSPAALRSLRYGTNENNENTPPRAARDNHHNGGEHGTPRGTGNQRRDASPASSDLNSSQPKETHGSGHKRSNSVDIRKMQSLFKTAAEDNIRSIRSYVTELKERVAKLQYQKQLLVCQVLELEANGNEEDEEEGDECNNDEFVLESVRSPSSWKPQFDQQRSLIFELWHACNVSIIHRTQFFLLFRGDIADSIYMEVELRRLTWLNENFKGEAASNHHNENSIEEELIPASPIRSNSAKSLKREKELLARQLSRRLTKEEREDLFMRWGVPLDVKQRKLQLINRLWSDPHNLQHIQASAEIVARIVGILNPGSAPKEMFALNFAPPNHAERPGMFGWNGLSALLNF